MQEKKFEGKSKNKKNNLIFFAIHTLVNGSRKMASS